MSVLRDEETDARVVCYLHPDGRILIDAVRLPEGNPKPDRSFVITEGKTVSGGVGRMPTTPKLPIKMIAQQPAVHPQAEVDSRQRETRLEK